MPLFQNGVIYGTENVLGYDKVGQEYVINGARAKTVRKVYDIYLAGDGPSSSKRNSSRCRTC